MDESRIMRIMAELSHALRETDHEVRKQLEQSFRATAGALYLRRAKAANSSNVRELSVYQSVFITVQP